MNKIYLLITVVFLSFNMNLCALQMDSLFRSQSVMFKVTDCHTSSYSYILGSIHTIPGDYVWEIPNFSNVIKEVKQIVCEKHLSKYSKLLAANEYIQDKDSLLRIRLNNLYTDSVGRPISFLLDLNASEQKICREVLSEKMGISDSSLWIPQNFFFDFQDIYISALKKIINKNGYNFHCFTTSIDSYITDTIALSLGLPVFELDEEDVLGVMNSTRRIVDDLYVNELPRNIYSQMIALSLVYYGELLTTSKQLAEAYFSCDVDKLLTYTTNETLEVKLFKERHKKWLNKLTNIISGKPSLIVVGIGHLFDRSNTLGILSSLYQLGYDIEPVTR